MRQHARNQIGQPVDPVIQMLQQPGAGLGHGLAEHIAPRRFRIQRSGVVRHLGNESQPCTQRRGARQLRAPGVDRLDRKPRRMQAQVPGAGC